MKINEIDKTFIRTTTQNTVVACVRSILLYFNINVTQDDLKEKLITDEKGKATLADLSTVFEHFGLNAEGFRAEAVSNLDELLNPAIIPVYLDDGREDFAIYYGKFEERYLIAIPSWGLNLYADWEFDAIWVDYILLEIKRNDN